MKAKTNKHAVRVRKQLRRHLRLTLIPHGANQYRPHLIRRSGLAVVVALVVGLQLYSFTTDSAVLGATQPVSTAELFKETNERRKESGLEPLVLESRLTKAAFLKAQDMLKQQYWAHTAPDGTTPWYWFSATGYNYAYAGENLAKDFGSAGAATTAWMASPDHRANILDPRYRDVGFAVTDGMLKGRQTTLIVALYAEPASVLAGSTAAAETAQPATGSSIDPGTRIWMAVRSFTPAALLALFLLLFASVVAILAHAYRNKLPRSLRQSWYRHHGAYKVAGLVSIAIIVISLYGGGQI